MAHSSIARVFPCFEGRVGGTPFITMNGNRWVGTGHNSMFKDLDGKWWTSYHAVDRFEPYFEGAIGFTKRPVLLDPVDWVKGWPRVQGGSWASERQGKRPAADRARRSINDRDHDEARVPAGCSTCRGIQRPPEARWSWVRQPAFYLYRSISNGASVRYSGADLFVDSNNASVLIEKPALDGDYMGCRNAAKLNVPPVGAASTTCRRAW